MTLVEGSCSQYCSRSLPEMSALLPIEAKLDIPNPSSRACWMSAMPRAPDCDEKARVPRPGTDGAKLALRRTAGLRFMTPRQLGPMIRMP